MNNKSTISANIDNLTTFWKTACLPFDSYFPGIDFNYCAIKNSDWPNRLWFNQAISEGGLDEAIRIFQTYPLPLMLPYFDRYDNKQEALLRSNGFHVQFKQTGMSLKLAKPFDESTRLNLKLVFNEVDAALWSSLYPKAFGYRISAQTIVKAFKNIYYYLAYYDDLPIGTAVLFYTNRIAGIHSVGVVPEMRKRGFAEEIMKILLNKSLQANAVYATLQASEMGKGIYLKLGFEEQFLIKNYIYESKNSKRFAQ